jgi:hypothetical protein
MNRLITTTIILSLVLFSCKSNTQKNSLETMHLNGKIKSIKEYSYLANEKFGLIHKGERKREYSWEYDLVYIFNKCGSKIEERNIYLNDDTQSKRIFTFDNNEMLIESNYYDSKNNLISKTKMKNDDKGNEIELNDYNSYGELNTKWLYKYDSRDNQIEGNNYSSDGNLSSRWTYNYDSNGNKIETNCFDSNGNISFKWATLYDKKGNAIECKYLNSLGTITSKWTMEYDENNNKTVYNYNDFENNTAENRTYKYDYDKTNNWTRQIIFKNGIPLFIIEREIEYY